MTACMKCTRLSDLQQRDDHSAIIDLYGKGGHVRTVPVPNWIKATVDAWLGGVLVPFGVRALARKSCGGWCVNMPRSPQSKNSPLMTFAVPVPGFVTRLGVSLNRFNFSSVIDL